MGNPTDDLDRFLKTDGIQILMEAGFTVRNHSKSRITSDNQKGETNNVEAGKNHSYLQGMRQRK